MAELHPDLEAAVAEVVEAARDQDAEFKRRFRRLIENATGSNLLDNDVRDVIDLAQVPDALDD